MSDKVPDCIKDCEACNYEAECREESKMICDKCGGRTVVHSEKIPFVGWRWCPTCKEYL